MPRTNDRSAELVSCDGVGSMNDSVIQRFMANVERIPGVDCWIFVGYSSAGYGQMMVDKKTIGAHRLSWMIHRGEIPEGIRVLHKCDNSFCVNPDHLFLGTQAENMADMARKGRASRGDDHVHAKLSADAVGKIRMDSRSIREIAREFGVGHVTILRVKRGERWAHVQ